MLKAMHNVGLFHDMVIQADQAVYKWACSNIALDNFTSSYFIRNSAMFNDPDMFARAILFKNQIQIIKDIFKSIVEYLSAEQIDVITKRYKLRTCIDFADLFEDNWDRMSTNALIGISKYITGYGMSVALSDAVNKRNSAKLAKWLDVFGERYYRTALIRVLGSRVFYRLEWAEGVSLVLQYIKRTGKFLHSYEYLQKMRISRNPILNELSSDAIGYLENVGATNETE